MKRVLPVLGFVCAVTLAGGWLFAQQPPPPQQPTPGPAAGAETRRGGGRMGPGGEAGEGFMVDRLINDPAMVKQLNLSQDQTGQLRVLQADVKKQMIDPGSRMEKAAQKQAELISAASPDEAAIMKAVEETGAIGTEIAKIRVKHLLAVMKVLTPEQQQRLKEMQRERMQKRTEFRDKRNASATGPASPSTPPPPPPPPPPPAPANQ